MKKRSLTLKGHRTSVLLEAEFWAALEEISVQKKTSLARLVEEVDDARGQANLASALRVFVLKHQRPN